MMKTVKDTGSENSQKTEGRRSPVWLIALVPLVLLAALVAWFLNSNPIRVSTAELPPVEELSFERVVLTTEGFELTVRNSGPDEVEVAQVLVDEAYWQYTMTPKNRLGRLERGTITVAYPWVETEPFEVVVITRTGLTFAHEVELATLTPEPGGEQLLAYGLVGLYVGIIPVGLGLLWFPAMRRMGRKGLNFALALTVGLLVFLLVDTLLEAIEVSAELPGVFQGVPLALFAALLTWLAITAVGNRGGVSDRNSAQGRRFVAFLIALGIGFHNLGEGLVVGAAFALGEAALGSFLVVGFILHNITEGVGIAAPVTKDRPPLWWFLLLLLVAGGPAIAGTLIGGFAFSPLLAVLFLGIGLGAIWQVIVEVGMLMRRDAEREGEPLVTWPNVAGLLLGIAIMYGTAFLVKF